MLEKYITLTVIIVAFLTGGVTELIKLVWKEGKARSIALPFVALVVGMALMAIIEILNGSKAYGTMVIDGVFASLLSQFVYDKIIKQVSVSREAE